jgi:DUF4097 and DUF4098 domain-containing protein YvlB
MPTFATPEPIIANIEPGVGNVHVIASDRTDTVVDVRPTDESEPSDVKAAQQTVVDFSAGTLTVKGPRISPLDISRKSRSIEVTVELPTGSRVYGSTSLGDLRADGRLGECRYKSATGHLRLYHTGELNIRTSAGNVVVDRVDGNADISTSSGRVQIGPVTGRADVKNSNGATTIDSVGGRLKVRSANGDITVEHAMDGVDAKTANGAVRVLDAVRGALTLETAMGDIELGIREGTAAWLDVKTSFGRVRNELTESAAPEAAVDKVEVRANTTFGDITVRRS